MENRSPRLQRFNSDITHYTFNTTQSLRFSRGVTIIEVLISFLLIVLVSIATLQYFAYAKGNIGKSGNRRAALEQARQRLEQLMATPVDSIKPGDNVLYWLTCNNPPTCNAWTMLNAAPGTPENVLVEDMGLLPIETTVQWIDDPSSAGTQNTLELSTKVWFTIAAPATSDNDFNRVHLRTLRTPSSAS